MIENLSEGAGGISLLLVASGGMTYMALHLSEGSSFNRLELGLRRGSGAQGQGTGGGWGVEISGEVQGMRIRGISG